MAVFICVLHHLFFPCSSSYKLKDAGNEGCAEDMATLHKHAHQHITLIQGVTNDKSIFYSPAVICVTFLDLHRVHFSFSTCLLSLSHHMTNHPSTSIIWPITWLVTWPPTWPVTCHSSHLLFKSPVLYHLLSSHLCITWHSLAWPYMTLSSTPDLSLFAYLSLTSGFSACLLFLLHSLVLQLILTPSLLPSCASQFCSRWLHLLNYDLLLVQVPVVLGSSHTISSHVYKPLHFPRVRP